MAQGTLVLAYSMSEPCQRGYTVNGEGFQSTLQPVAREDFITTPAAAAATATGSRVTSREVHLKGANPRDASAKRCAGFTGGEATGLQSKLTARRWSSCGQPIPFLQCYSLAGARTLSLPLGPRKGQSNFWI
jgi:hypothetical protein